MLTVKERGTLLYIIEHCKRIEQKITGISLEDFLNNDDLKEIISFNILQIGELVKNLSYDFIKQYSKMPWKDIKGMRDWVAHGYNIINLEEIWATATQDISPLKEYCEEILKEDNIE